MLIKTALPSNQVQYSRRRDGGRSMILGIGGDNLRVFPALVMDKILIGTLAIIKINMPQVHDLGLVEDFMMETENLLISVVV